MSSYVSLNGKFHTEESLLFTVHNRAFKYGDGLFETIKCINGKPLFLDAHLQRLYAGMEILDMDWNDQLLKSIVTEEISRVLVRNHFNEGARLRISVFRNDGGLYTPETNQTSVLIQAWSDTNEYQLNKMGLNVAIYEEISKPIHPFSAIKSTNALLFVKAGIEKIKQGVDDLIILNSKGLICETISSNIFMVIHNRLVTPPLSEGCLPGTMRQNVLALAPVLGMEVLETPIGINAFEQAEEVFTTNAVNGAQWIKGFGPKRYFHKVSERIIEELNKAIRTKRTDASK